MHPDNTWSRAELRPTIWVIGSVVSVSHHVFITLTAGTDLGGGVTRVTSS